MLRQVILAHFEPIGTGFGPWKIPKCLEKGPFWEQKWVKNGSKRVFPKVILNRWGCTKKCFEPVLIDISQFCHMYAPSCTLRTHLRAVWWSHLELRRGV